MPDRVRYYGWATDSEDALAQARDSEGLYCGVPFGYAVREVPAADVAGIIAAEPILTEQLWRHLARLGPAAAGPLM